MWDTWNWMGTAMSAKVKAESDEKSRQMDWAINEAKMAKESQVAQLEADTKRYTVETETTSREKIAEADRLSREEIAQKDRDARERIVMLQTIGQIAPKVLPVALGAKMLSDKDNKNNGNKPSNTPQSPVPVVVTTGAQLANEKSKTDADKLFPGLEPTFKSMSSSNKVVKMTLGAALTGAVMSMLSSIPLII